MAQDNKRYYWLKLKRDFFKRPEMRVIEEMENGKDYLLFYLKLLVESIDREGELRFSDTIPYNDKMLSVVTNTNVDIVRNALKLFADLKLIEIVEGQTIFMTEVEKMLGSETEWAEKKRKWRLENQNRIEDKKRTNEDTARTFEDNVRQEKEIEKEKEKELEKNNIAELARQIVSHLNEVAGTAYKSNSKATLRHISARLNEGYLLEEFYAVIDKKWREWGGSDMEKYMRPETLFGSKFEGYLNEPETQKKKKGGTQQTSGPVDWDAYV